MYIDYHAPNYLKEVLDFKNINDLLMIYLDELGSPR